MRRHRFLFFLLSWTLAFSSVGRCQDPPTNDPDAEEKAGKEDPKDLEFVLPSELRDPSFERTIDMKALARAFEEVDLLQLTDLALEMADRERVLMRPHKATTAKEMMSRIAVLAAKKRDTAALERLLKYAELNKVSELQETLAPLMLLAKASRSVAASIDLKGLSAEESRLAEIVQGDIDRVRVLGNRADADAVGVFIKVCKEDSLLPEKVAQALTARLDVVKKDIPKAEKKEDDVLGKLSQGSRGVLDNIFGKPPQIVRNRNKPQGPKWDTNRSYYPIGNQKLRLAAGRISGKNWNKASMDAAARSLIAANQNRTHVWDRAWYQARLPENYSEYWLATATNSTTGAYRWAAIRNTPSRWIVLWNNGEYDYPRNGQSVHHTWRETFNNRRVQIYVHNPTNEGYVDNADIWYMFSWE